MSARGICVRTLLMALLIAPAQSWAGPLYFDAGTSTIWDDGTTANWASSPGPPYNAVWSAGADAHFEGTAGTVNVAGTITSVSAITFDSSGYTLAGGTITVTGDGRISGGGDNTISSIIAGSVPIAKLGDGKLTLTGTNTFAGQITVAEGVLSINGWNADNTSGRLGQSSSRVVLGGAGTTGTLEYTGSLSNSPSTLRGIELATGGTGKVQLSSAATTRSNHYVHLNGSKIVGSGALIIDSSYNGAYTSRFIIVDNTAITGPITVNPYSELQNNLASAGDNTPFGTGTITVSSNAILNVFRNASDATAILGGLAGAGRVHAESSGVKTYKIGANNESTLFSGTIANSASGTGTTVAVTKIGTGTLTLSGVNTFSGPLRVENGALVLSGANTFIGQVTVAGGTLRIGEWNNHDIAGPLGQSANKVQLNGGTIQYTGGSVAPNKSLHMAGAGTIDVVNAGTVLNLGAAGSNSLTGSGDIIKAGAGTLQLAQASVGQASWSGKLIINAGTVDFFGSDSMPKPASFVPDAVQINDGGTFAFSHSGTSPSGSSPNASIGFQLGGNAGFAISSGTHALQGVIANKPGQTGNLIKSGNGTLVLSGDNTYSGTTTVTAAALALQGGNNRISTGSPVITNGAVLALGGNNQTVGNVGSSGTGNGMVGAIENGNLRFTGNMYVKSGTVAANLSNAGGSTGRLWIGGDTSAAVLLAGNNTHTYSDNYATIIGHSTTGAAGIVRMGGNNALGGASNRTDVYSGTLDLNGQNAVVQQQIRLMSTGSAFLVNNNTAADAATAANVVMNSANSIGGAANMTLGGVVSGTGILTKIGAGSLTLSNGANTHTGAIMLDAGILLVNGSTHASSAVTVRANATLGGTGTVGGATTIQSGGRLAPGNSIGTLSFGGPVTLNAGAVWDWEFVDNSPGNYDQATGPQLVLPAAGEVTFNIHGLTGHSVFPGDRFTVSTGNVENFSSDRVALNNL
ncbi:MAG: autotransporter-associated beta strand repeat-containing protein, partial [Patescibacteria group bacterium]|nr:autotransporter-associated beta strand repeat-containing protein [Patescibacteria group bacterium]